METIKTFPHLRKFWFLHNIEPEKNRFLERCKNE